MSRLFTHSRTGDTQAVPQALEAWFETRGWQPADTTPDSTGQESDIEIIIDLASGEGEPETPKE